MLVVRHAKFDTSRLVPLHPSSVTALTGYLDLRARLQPDPSSPALLVSTRGTRLLHSNVGLTFNVAGPPGGITRRSASCRPRIHDLRHCFAVATVLDWYRAGVDVAAMMPRLSTYLGHTDPKDTYWYLEAAPELMALAGQRLDTHLAAHRQPPGRDTVNTLAPTLQTFFTDRLVRQRQVSDHTIAAYRDAIRLLLVFAAERTGKPPSRLDIADLDAPLIGAFLDHLQHARGNSVRTRNARLAAIHSLFRHAALQRPRGRRGDRPGAGDPTQTLRRHPGHLPDRGRGRRVAGRLRPGHLDRTTRPGAADAGLPDRATRQRTDPPEDHGRAPGRRPARVLRRQGPQAADHPAHCRDRHPGAGLADRTRRPAATIRCSRPERAPR